MMQYVIYILAQPVLHDIDSDFLSIDDAVCNDTLTLCNLITNVDFVPLSLGFHTHVTSCMHNDVVPILPHDVWGDVLTLISQIIPSSHSTTMSTTSHDSGGDCTFQSCILLS
jgi:hypothetical protein